MKVDRTKYTAHYENGMVVAQWISVEMALDGANGESPLDALDRSQELVDKWYKSKNIEPASYLGSCELPVINTSKDDVKIGITVDDIMSCNDLPTIDSYRLIVKGKEELDKAYMIRRQEIKDGEIKSILERTEKLRAK